MRNTAFPCNFNTGYNKNAACMKRMVHISAGLFIASALMFFLASGALSAAGVSRSGQKRKSAAETDVFMSEDFSNLRNWMPYNLFKKKKETLYAPDVKDGVQCVKAQSDRSASALVYKKEFDVYKYPIVKWKWMVGNIYPNGNLEKKSGNDSPARLYILFKYNPKKAGFFTRLKYAMAKMIYGVYPPGSNLCYLWANHRHRKKILTSPAWKYSKDIVIEAGASRLNEWRHEEVDIPEDYRAAFGKDPPRMAAIAIMDNSDNTKGKSTSWFGPIEISGPGVAASGPAPEGADGRTVPSITRLLPSALQNGTNRNRSQN